MGAGEAVGLRRPARAPHLALLCVLALVALALAAQPAPVVEPGRSADLGATPLSFVANAGQTDTAVRYMARGAHHAFYFTPDKAVLDFQRGTRGVALQLRFRGANPAPQIVAEQPTGARVSYLTGAQPQRDLAAYEQVRYRSLWPGIDMVFRGHGGALKYEFHVAPGANPRDIRLAYAGADSLRLAANGALAIATPLGTLRDAAPKSVQGTRAVDSRYVVSGASYGFALGAYDRSKPLVIDPGLVWSTYLGGLDSDIVAAVEVDESGNAYVTGETRSASFPTTPGAYDLVVDGIFDAFVSKLDGNGALVYSTYLGGSSDDRGLDLDVSGGDAYVLGFSSSTDFPTTPGAYDGTLVGFGEYFVTKLNSAGSALSFSTFVPGGQVTGIAVDASGRSYLTGTAFIDQPIPISPSAPDNTAVSSEAFLERLNASGTAFDWATYIGGRGEENGRAIELDGAGEPYVVGTTTSVEHFPFTPGAYDTVNESESFFVAKVDSGGTAFDYATLLGNGFNPGLDVDAAGHAYVIGTGSLPATPGAYDDDGCSFVAKMNLTGTALVYSTRLGEMCNANSIVVDPAGNAYVTQSAQSGSLPTTPGAFDTQRNGIDVYLFKLNSTGTGQLYGTYLGGSNTEFERGIAAVGTNSVVIGGYTQSTDFPTTPGAHDETYNDSNIRDGFVTRLQTFDGYPRPKGATPLRLSLVLAYKQCFGGNRTHGPPLAFGSCAPPAQESSFLTVGTADANGKPALNEAYLRLDTIPGNPATPADEADVGIEFFMDDVFIKSSLTDYTGELRPLMFARIVDRDVPNSVMSTIQDIGIPMVAQCSATADPAEGSSCTLNTSIGAIAGPVAIHEGKRSIWQIVEARVDDGGPDGNAETLADNIVFARPGVFVP